MGKKLRYILLAIVALVVLVPSVMVGPYWLRVQRFEANTALGYQADFYLYVSPAAKKIAEEGGRMTLLVQPNNSGTNSDDPEVHRKDAWWMGFGRHFLANELGVALLVPAFVRPAEDWHIYTHALDRDVLTTDRIDLGRIDLQLLSMTTKARATLADEGLPVREKFLLQGYSASGMFANRFTALHPSHVLAIAAGSPGGWPIAPVASYQDTTLPYPAGIGDLEMLTGQPFDSTAYSQVPQLIVMGEDDENDSLDFSDGWSKATAALVDNLFGPDPLSRWDKSIMLHKKAGAQARFLLIENVGHDRKALQSYSTDFFKEVLEESL